MLRLPASITEIIALAGGVLILAAVAMRARAWWARRAGETVQQESWGPGIVFGMVSVAVAAWAPLPVVRGTPAVTRVHAAAPVTLGLVGTVVLLGLAVV